LLQQLLNFSSKVPLRFLHPFVAHGLVFRRIRLYFASVQRYATELYRARRQRQLQYLLKQILKSIEVNISEIRNRAESCWSS
jgi:hypothetical protein